MFFILLSLYVALFSLYYSSCWASSQVFYNTRVQQKSVKACNVGICSTSSGQLLEDCCIKETGQWCTPTGSVCCGCDASGKCYDCLNGDFCMGNLGCANSWGIVIIAVLVVLVLIGCVVAVCAVCRRRKRVQKL
eukprot:TRINITY_DN4200_c0_g1_i1.p1 TRINITY_DN4200_c0_g1~~TRINITY_DN4200_c0_g1_i1.p1  ORF type:complete len:134 (-),score=17.31 TRINITY_DN4200_c0_g1_i1:97-498(-)